VTEGAGLQRAFAPVLAVLLLAGLSLLAGCTTASGPPVATRLPHQSLWVVAEAWGGFVQNEVCPQEWSLRRWHVWKTQTGRLSLTPVSSLPAAPEFLPFDMGGDPKVWRVDYTGGAAEPTRTFTVMVVTFPASETQGLPPSLYALRQALPPGSSGEVRVARVRYDRGRFLVGLELSAASVRK